MLFAGPIAAQNASIPPSPAAAAVAAGSIPPHPGRNGLLTPRELAMANAAWHYFVGATQAQTGLANSVGSYPSTTMWDTASYLSALVSAYELGLIGKPEFDLRTLKLLGTIRNLTLFRGELPNKVYNTQTGAEVDYANKPGEVGYSALDVGRLLVWLEILKERYPYFANSVDEVVLRWSFCHVVDKEGRLYGAGVGPKGETTYFQEGRLGYEEYGAKGFGLWGFDTRRASLAAPYAITEIYGIKVPYDSRDPRVFKTENYVLTESYVLDGIELNWDLPDDDYSDAMLHTDGWRAEFAQRVYMAQQRRFEETGVSTARTEHQVEGDPYFVYDTVFADGYAWNTLSPRNEFVPDRAAVAVKGAIGMWALWDTPYTSQLFEQVADLYTPEGGFYEGIYENGSGYIPLQTANNNGILLAALLYKVEGPILQRRNPNKQAWYTAFADQDIREQHCLPTHPLAVECPAASLCAVPPPPEPALHLTDFEYCDPVPAAKWYPGCAFTHPEPAARNCRTGTAETRTVPPAPPAPGSLCPIKPSPSDAAKP
jgi:hypothetical protein